MTWKRTGHSGKPDFLYFNEATYYDLYFKSCDVNKLEDKIEEDFRVKMEIGKKNFLDEVFGIWKNEDITLGSMRDKAWHS